jgi:hypothetical protein
MLVRDYFAQGFYPDGTSTNVSNASDQVPVLSGALVKAVLVASADFVGEGSVRGDNLDNDYRFNTEQGYGRVQLSNVLPLRTLAGTPSGIVVADVGMPGGRNDMPGFVPANAGSTQPFGFTVCRRIKICALPWRGWTRRGRATSSKTSTSS